MADMQVTTQEVKKSIKDAQSAEDAMRIAGMDWHVDQVPMVTASGLDVPKHKALVRSDNSRVLAVVGKDFQPLQNHEAFAFADTFRDRFGGNYESAYCLSHGARIMLQLKINGGFDLPSKEGEDHIDKYLTLFENRGGGGVQGFFTTIRVFCTNQFRSLKNNKAESFSIRHTKNMKARIEEAFTVFSMSQKWFQVFEEKARYLAQKQVDKKMVESFLDTVIGLPITEEWNEEQGKNIRVEHPRILAQRARVVELFEGGKGNHGENAWELMHGVTEMVDHYKHVNNADKRFSSALLGSGADVKQVAFEAAMAL